MGKEVELGSYMGQGAGVGNGKVHRVFMLYALMQPLLI